MTIKLFNATLYCMRRKAEQASTSFPLEGTFEAVPYRIDGDAVIVKCSSGKEMQIGPKPDLPADLEEALKSGAEVEAFMRGYAVFSLYRPTSFTEVEHKNENVHVKPIGPKVWDIEEEEYLRMKEVGYKILFAFFRAKSKSS